MTVLHNTTPFAALELPSVDAAGRDACVVIVAASFVMDTTPRIAEQQPAPPLVDTYWGDPASSSLRRENQAACVRPGTDIYLEGHAWSAGGQPVTRSLVDVVVGPCRRAAVVTGERRWLRGVLGLHPSDPQPFTSVPLRHEYAAGGPHEPRNPVGRGHGSAREAEDQVLPAIEAVDEPCQRWDERTTPVGFGPIARHWRPRIDHAGTYDATWVERRAPLWPEDLDLRFFNAAAPGLVALPGLVGDEPVHLEGVRPDGPIDFKLPRLRLRATLQSRRARRHQAMVLDAVALYPDTRRFTMFLRTAFILDEPWLDLESATIRTLEPWEAP